LHGFVLFGGLAVYSSRSIRNCRRAVNIFGYPIYVGKMERHEYYKEQFMPFLKDDKYFMKHKEWASANDTTLGHPLNKELPWEEIADEAIHHVFQYLQPFYPKDNIQCYADPWLNRYFKDDYQEVHSHTAMNTNFSCAYMLVKPDDEHNFCFVDKVQEFWNSIGIDRYCERVPEKMFVPEQEEGTIIIFPSNLDHFVKRNASEGMRASISMNFLLGR
jgi:hypothetical protein